MGLILLDDVAPGVTDEHSNERGATMLKKQSRNTHEEVITEHLHFVEASVKKVLEWVQVKCNEKGHINAYQKIKLDMKVTEDQA